MASDAAIEDLLGSKTSAKSITQVFLESSEQVREGQAMLPSLFNRWGPRSGGQPSVIT